MINIVDFRIRKLALILVLLSGVSTFTSRFGYNIIDAVGNRFGENGAYLLSLVTCICAIFLAFRGDIWLPFLKDTIMPCTLINKEPSKEANTIVTIKTNPNRKIAYWAANKPSTNEQYPNPAEAYNGFENAGVTYSDANGLAKLYIVRPTGYKIGAGNTLSPHVHFRECPEEENGMIGPVETVFI
jgi:hypothetical protein